jgi:hypothetical protein
LGVAEPLRTLTPPSLDLDGDRVTFLIPVRVPASQVEAERQSTMRVSLPELAIVSDEETVRHTLRDEFPLMCARCGLVYRERTRHCESPAGCWGGLRWRRVSPQPTYYIETEDNYGYFSPGPRGLRYAIDLGDFGVFGVQYTLRYKEKWRTPTDWVVHDVVHRLSHTVALDLPHAIAGERSDHARPCCLVRDPPAWCAADAERLPLRAHSKSRLRIA